ncbi:putative transcription factor & chromatin remodeling DDT family [Helianthus annuus]|nr:putative transcription factor & chromatin remodeling DDT family [Helianthus annuus]
MQESRCLLRLKEFSRAGVDHIDMLVQFIKLGSLPLIQFSSRKFKGSTLLIFAYAEEKVCMSRFGWIVDWCIGPMFTGSELCFRLNGRGGGMEPAAGKRKGRKRKRKDGEDVDKPEKTARKTVLAIRSVVLIERESASCRDDEMDGAFRKRKKSLDQYVLKKYGKNESVRRDAISKKVENVGNDDAVKSAEDHKDETVSNDNHANADKVESSAAGADWVEVDSESSSDLSDYEPSVDVVEVERPWVPPPQLPPSSGNLGVPEEDVSHLLSVYSFMRSFSVCLFLSPFGLDEFVGALNSSVHNTLLDAIHVSLIRALKSHVETLSSEGSELASKCPRIMDWSLLDSLTWPVLSSNHELAVYTRNKKSP